MGRHGAEQAANARRAPVALVGVVVLLLATIGLGWWWWSIRSQSDPIDASPVDGYGVVLSSPVCGGSGNDTMVDLLGLNPPVRATVNACGHRENERIAVQYLSSDPTRARVAGTSTAGTSTARRWIPIAILGAGVLAIGSTLLLLTDRRRVRQVTDARRLSVAELQRAVSKEPPGPAQLPGSAGGLGADPATRPMANLTGWLTPAQDGLPVDGDHLDGSGRPWLSAPIIDVDLFTHRTPPDPELSTHPGPPDR